MKHFCLFSILVLGICGCNKDNSTVIPSNRVQIPLVFTGNSSPKIQIIVGNTPVDVTFDTGSYGLRILKGALSGESLISLNQRVSSGYAGSNHGLNMRGDVVEASFSFGTLKSQQPIPFMLIDSVQYISNSIASSWISVSNQASLPPDSVYGGFSATMGVGMRMDTSVVGSPITQMPGNGNYIVHFPNAGQTTGGYVIFNPSTLDMAKFENALQLTSSANFLPNGNKSYFDNSLPGVLTVNGVPYARPTLLDTGNPAVWTQEPSIHNYTVVSSGGIVSMSIGNRPIVADTTFTVHYQTPGIDLVELNYNASAVTNSFGQQFFYYYDVLFDAVKGRIWIAKK